MTNDESVRGTNEWRRADLEEQPAAGAALRLGANNTRLSAARLLLRPAIGLYRWLNPAVR